MQVSLKDGMVKGKPAAVPCLTINGQTYTISSGPARVVALEEEWYEDVYDPYAVIDGLQTANAPADIFTFWQRVPDLEPRFAFHREHEELAVLRVTSFDDWWTKQIKSRTRSLIRKSEKLGVEVRRAVWDDEFVRGMTAIFNETPIRQGRPFWHYGKDFETVKRQFSRYLFREELIGAYYRGQLIGFMMVADAGRYALTGQILSAVEHRDKAPNNALIAKAVELCAEKQWPYLIYLNWGTGSFSEFKRRCGFERTAVPRYYVPLTTRGKWALRLGMHRGWRNAIPEPVRERLKQARSRWYSVSHD